MLFRSDRTKRKVADGVRRNGAISARRGRPKSVSEAATVVAAAEPAAAASETSAIFQASNLAIPAAASDEAQQASA